MNKSGHSKPTTNTARRNVLKAIGIGTAMLAHMETIPGFDKVAKMPAYPGKKFDGVVKRGRRSPSKSK